MRACIALRPRNWWGLACHRRDFWHSSSALVCIAVLTVGTTASLHQADRIESYAGRPTGGERALQNTVAEVPDDQKRPFKVAFYYDLGPTQEQEIVEYTQGTLMPAAASVLCRWIRVRACSCRQLSTLIMILLL